MSTDHLGEFRAALQNNRDVFPKAFPWADANVLRLLHRADDVLHFLRTATDARGKSQFSMLPMMMLLQRQIIAAYELFSSFRSFQGWLLFRPGIEAILITGVWRDDRQTAEIWRDRQKHRKEYRKVYQGLGLESHSLPNSQRIRAVLSRLNDDFPHPNADYSRRHLGISPIDPENFLLTLDYFDDATVAEANLLAFLMASAVVIDSFAQMVARIFEASPIQAVAPEIASELGPRCLKLIERDEAASDVLRRLGLWELEKVGA